MALSSLFLKDIFLLYAKNYILIKGKNTAEKSGRGRR
jgi:hypothetical protein